MKEKITPLYDELKPTFDRFASNDDNKALLVFTNAWAELSYYSVVEEKYAWSEHDRIVEARGGGYAIMAFDLARSFDEQFCKERHGNLCREGLSVFALNPLINIRDKTGVIPADEQKKKEHTMIHAAQVGSVTGDSKSNETIPNRQPFTPIFVK